MLSTEEKRFIQYWEEQRKGGKGSYYLLYILIGTFIITIILSVFLVLFFQIAFGSIFFWIVLSGGILFSSLLTVISWNRNEKKLKQIIRREVAKGKSADQHEKS